MDEDRLSFSQVSSTQDRLDMAREEQELLDRQYEEIYKKEQKTI
jgi:hypothetical protein